MHAFTATEQRDLANISEAISFLEAEDLGMLSDPPVTAGNTPTTTTAAAVTATTVSTAVSTAAATITTAATTAATVTTSATVTSATTAATTSDTGVVEVTGANTPAEEGTTRQATPMDVDQTGEWCTAQFEAFSSYP